MNHNAHIPLARREMTPAILAGAPIYDTDDTKIATIAEVYGFGAADGVVINVGGSFWHRRKAGFDRRRSFELGARRGW